MQQIPALSSCPTTSAMGEEAWTGEYLLLSTVEKLEDFDDLLNKAEVVDTFEDDNFHVAIQELLTEENRTEGVDVEIEVTLDLDSPLDVMGSSELQTEEMNIDTAVEEHQDTSKKDDLILELLFVDSWKQGEYKNIVIDANEDVADCKSEDLHLHSWPKRIYMFSEKPNTCLMWGQQKREHQKEN